GAHTILYQMIAEVLVIPFERVQLQVGTTDSFRSEAGTGASRVTFVLGQAVLKAADKLKALIRQRGAEMLGVSPDDLILKAGRVIVQGGDGRSFAFEEIAATAIAKGDRVGGEGYYEETEPRPAGLFTHWLAGL